MKYLFCLFLFVSTAAYAAGSGGVNAPDQRDKPYLILVSIDGFRWDYPDPGITPTLDRIAANGIRAQELVPVFPTLTFPNHYSIATGLYPANHGLIGNRFPSKDRTKFYSLYDRDSVQDGSWYRRCNRSGWLPRKAAWLPPPIFLLARRQQLATCR